ncbi:MAG: helix-turn-helix domain-containing protein [Oscillospiraceae bacterium]
MGLNKPKRSVIFVLNNTKEILALKELQELLHIGKNTALRLVQSGEIEGFRVGNRWRIMKDNVAKYI